MEQFDSSVEESSRVSEQQQRNDEQVQVVRQMSHDKAPQYLVDCCTPVTDVVVWQRLRSATANDGGAMTSAIHCWPPSIRCARPHGLELLVGRPPRTAGL